MRSILKWGVMILTSLLIMLIVILPIALWPGTATKVPTVKFYYGAAIDSYLCSSKEKMRITPAWHDELKSVLPLLQQEWNKSGPLLLAETSRLTQKPFSYAEFDIPVFLCPNLPGIGFPLMIPVRMFLRNAVTSKPWKRTDFVDIVYHELLHVYVARALHWNYWTPLLTKYRNESFNTKIHLHLFALQKAVYLKLGMQKRWQFVVSLNMQFSPAYTRAIEIVEQEGYQPFIDELKK